MGDFVKLLDRIVDKLPYSDGAVRRRMFAGGVLLIGLSIPYGPNIVSFVEGTLRVTVSPLLLAAGAGLLLYLAGTVLEVLDQRFVLPLAALLHRPFERRQLQDRLTMRGRAALSTLPERVQLGLEHPLGEHRALAVHYLTGCFRNPRNQRWCRRLFSHTSDVAVAGTAVITLILVLLVTTLSAGPLQESGDLYGAQARLAAGLLARIPRSGDTVLDTELDDAEGIVSPQSPTPGATASAKARVETYLKHNDPQGAGGPSSAELELYLGYVNGQVPWLRTQLQNIQSSLSSGPVAPPLPFKAFFDERAKWVGEMRDLLIEWKASAEQREQIRNSRTLLTVLPIVSAPLLFALYRTYFKALRNAIITALEGLAIERAEVELSPHVPGGMGDWSDQAT